MGNKRGIQQINSSTKISAQDVANYFLSKANSDGDLISNLKMQKLLYYAQAWHLANFNSKLFKDDIEAWDFGPVVRAVYDRFKKYAASPIAYKETKKEKEMFNKKQLDYLDEFYRIFIRFPAHELVNMSHNELPWKETYKNKNIRIPAEIMRDFYSDILNKSKRSEKK